ncbi:hypothetical protein NNJEOMEG_03409 [Fundidesulfovibrio magnetotacticus]|uniref:TIGR02453 family protein n=1 Tax=Fundidesulfovibrio magnetotacticus TaxID=2730080 RepID=A0A6V8LST8_9BACT|nr:TIGR02453 family protein [Fundidesulfovibrio magnetotacticus]GFK95543.1 hypothetical protein NNJEOMEG_03409 [Fundidesulfovibrio magnetotacticus]
MSERFTGFPPEGLAFLAELARLQGEHDFAGARELYQRDKALYERSLRAPLGALAGAVSARVRELGLPLQGDARTALFRINRDVRFSPDKSPYKTHAGAVITRSGSRKEQGLFYIHIAPDGCFAAAGFYQPAPAQLAALREAMRSKTAGFPGVLAALAAHGLHLDERESLKRLPRGFEDVADPELARAVKLKHLTVSWPLDFALTRSPELPELLADYALQAAPLLRFGWAALDAMEAAEIPR